MRVRSGLFKTTTGLLPSLRFQFGKNAFELLDLSLNAEFLGTIFGATGLQTRQLLKRVVNVMILALA